MAWSKGESGNLAGRPARAERYARPIARAEKRIADRLPELIDNLFKLADGGFELGADTLEPAGTITIGTGEHLTPAFPNLDPNTLVVVRQTRSIAAPDRAANIYLVDRILGKPTEREEVSGPDGGPIQREDVSLSDTDRATRILAIVQRARERADRTAGPAEPDLDTPTGSTD